MYATNAVSTILGVSPEQFVDKSFYECIQENCLPEAIRCLESAKSNDSIAYLRFWYRDPRREEDHDQEMREASQSSDSEDGGVVLDGTMDVDPPQAAESSTANQTYGASADSPDQHRTSSGESTDLEHDSTGAIFDQSHGSRSSTSSLIIVSPEERRRARPRPSAQPRPEPFELEAVISCTSDGLVVILRRARPRIPQPRHDLPPIQAFAPWGVNPIQPHQYQPNPQFPFHHGFDAPQYPSGGPPLDDFMNVIRDVGCFAWSLVGINGNIGAYSRGIPKGEALPPFGIMPVWDPYVQPRPDYAPPENQAALRWARESRHESMDDHNSPFHHRLKEDHSRYQFGAGHESGNSASSGNGYLGYNPSPPGYLQGHAQDNFGNAQVQESSSGNPPPNANISPSSQGQGPREGGPTNRDLWS